MDHRSSSDVDMIEAETANQRRETPSTTTAGSENGVVWDLLSLARQCINQGKPTQALQAVVMAMRSEGGDEAVFRSLHRARELYKSRLQENVAADQLASMFAECAIAEAKPVRTEEEPPNNNIGSQWAEPDTHGASILAETGRMQIVLDASSDGSSFICLKCGGLVSSQRKDEHYAYWCCQI